ncbi:MAG: hypothetical protein HN732_24170 [Rhodospirillaceae bacterium]|jgi:hypothetical protein|nr:hypothetical protein [Rhodospirillaceae bacterium]MBT5894635.1 hypothetical protein [Rhodospirillaceae bacterium]MBT7760449.1 hypothetical protein [Rhodospirillaceae bacterium]
MQQAIASRKDRVFEDYQQRDYFSLETLVETETSDSPISIMLEYWLHLRDGASTSPRFQAFQLEKVWNLKIPHHLALIDCSAIDPYNYFVVRHPYDITNMPWLFGESISGVPIGDCPSPLLSWSVQADYHAAKEHENLDQLHYSRVRQVVNGIYRDYMRLLLPFTGSGGDVTMLASVTRLLQPKTRNPAFFPLIDPD